MAVLRVRARATSRLVISALAVAPLPACYAPDLADCTVACVANTDCAGDQICTSGVCAASGVTCSANNVGADAGDTADASPLIDSAPIPTTIALRLEIEGPAGNIHVANVGDCDHDSAPCTFTVAIGAHDLIAIPERTDKPFERWTSMVCAGQNELCTANLTTDVTVSAKFH